MRLFAIIGGVKLSGATRFTDPLAPLLPPILVPSESSHPILQRTGGWFFGSSLKQVDQDPTWVVSRHDPDGSCLMVVMQPFASEALRQRGNQDESNLL